MTVTDFRYNPKDKRAVKIRPKSHAIYRTAMACLHASAEIKQREGMDMNICDQYTNTRYFVISMSLCNV